MFKKEYSILLILLFSCQNPELPLGLNEEFEYWNEEIIGPKTIKDQQLINLEEEIKEARTLVSQYFQSELVSSPLMVYLETAEQFKTYGSEIPFIAMNKFDETGYILLNGPRNPDENAITHEWIHIEFHDRVGSAADAQTPVWFKEGMALQLDQSGMFHPDSLTRYGISLDSLPDYSEILKLEEFIDVPRSEIIMRMRISHYQFSQWYTLPRFNELMKRLSAGEHFQTVYADLSQH